MNGFVNYLCKEFDLTDIEKLKLKYSLDVLLLDVSKIIILFTLFYIIGETRNFLYSVFALFLIRPLTGGFHFKTYISCLIFTSLFFLCVIILNRIISLDYYAVYMMISSCIVILGIAPIINENRPSYSESKKKHFKIFALSVIIIHLVLYLIAKRNPYLNISIWVITLQSIQLLIKKGVDICEKSKLNKNFT